MSIRESMTACMLYGVGDLRIEQVNTPKPRPGQVVVGIRAAGICGSDVERVFSKGTYHYPTILGHEFSGEVADACEQDRSWLGKRVSVYPLIPCMNCPACLEGRYAQCGHYDYYGSRRDGGFAEYLAVNVWNLIGIPDEMSYESAAMLEPAAVALHAIRRAGELTGRTIAIFGVGTIALIMAQIARDSGCGEIILAARSREKADFAKGMGFSCAIDSREEDLQERIMEYTDGKGADIAVEGCGQSGALNDCVRAAAACGTVICMGNASEDMTLERDVYQQILRKQLRLIGTWNSSFRISHNDWEIVLGMARTGRLNLQGLITGRYALDQAREAFDDIRSGNGVHLKSMFVNKGDSR